MKFGLVGGRCPFPDLEKRGEEGEAYRKKKKDRFGTHVSSKIFTNMVRCRARGWQRERKKTKSAEGTRKGARATSPEWKEQNQSGFGQIDMNKRQNLVPQGPQGEKKRPTDGPERRAHKGRRENCAQREKTRF